MKVQKNLPLIKNKIKRRFSILKDKLFGYDFLTTIAPEKIGLDPKHFSICSPSANKYLINVINSLNISSKDSILDIGCGKGSVLNLLTKYKFKKISGIEISEELSDICKKNFLKKNDLRIKIFNQDARNFQNFYDYNFYYLYNPCSSEILLPIIKKIVDTSNEKKTLIYNFPKYEEILLLNGFRYVKTFEDEWGNGIKIYELDV